LRDSGFQNQACGLVDPAYFSNEVEANIVAVANDYYNRYKKAPSSKLIASIFNDAIKNKKFRSDLKPLLRDKLRELMVADLTDRAYVVDKVAEFAQHQAIENAIFKSVASLEKGRDYERIKRMIVDACAVGANLGEDGYDYFSEITNRHQERLDIVSGALAKDGISTGVKEIDAELYDSGWGRKALSVIMGAAKAGKSMSLGDFGKKASLLGFNVIYVSLEVSRKIIADRLDASFSDTAIRELMKNTHSVRGKIEDFAKKSGKFYLHEFATGTLKVSDLRRLLQRHRAKGIIFDLIIVDYADIMAPEIYTGDMTKDARQIYIDLRAVAFEENAAVLTATQTNREGAKAQVAKATDVAEDFNKIRTADVVLSINSIEEERKAGEARIYFAANRGGEDGFSLRIKQDRSKMQFVNKVIGRE